MELTGSVLVIAWSILTLVEMYFFLMQRAALELVRLADYEDRSSRHMLPLWFAFHWPIRLSRWAFYLFIGLQISWFLVIGLFVTYMVVIKFVPIPHNHFIPMFQKRIRKDMTGSYTGDRLTATKLWMALESAKFRMDQLS